MAEDFAVLVRRDDLVTITLGAERLGPTAQLRVADTGPGIPVEVQGHVFEPVFSTRAIGEGAGVGLDVSRRLALRNGSDLRFRSAPGETLFTLELPIGGRMEEAGTHGPEPSDLDR